MTVSFCPQGSTFLIMNSADPDTKSLVILGAVGHSISNTISLKEVRRAICRFKNLEVQ